MNIMIQGKCKTWLHEGHELDGAGTIVAALSNWYCLRHAPPEVQVCTTVKCYTQYQRIHMNLEWIIARVAYTAAAPVCHGLTLDGATLTLFLIIN